MNNKMPLHLYGSEAILGTKDKRPSIKTTVTPPLLLLLRKFQGFESCEPRTLDEEQRNMGITKYILPINHNITGTLQTLCTSKSYK